MTTTPAYNIVRTAQIDSTRLPKYRFTDISPVDGVIMLNAYSSMLYASDGNEISIDVEDNIEGNVRDCILVIDVPEGISAPTIVWSDKFSSRTDDSDFICDAASKNVYWITEYSADKFVVARWQDVSGGNI